MTVITNLPLPDPMRTYNYCLYMRNRRKGQCSTAHPIWLRPAFKAWSLATESALSIVKGSFRTRFDVKDFCVDILEALRTAKVPVFWVMKATGVDDTSQGLCTVEIIKSLVLQALRLDPTLRTERSMALSCAMFHAANTEEDWFDLLGSVIIDIAEEVYLVIDLEALDSSQLSLTQDFSWPDFLQALFRKLSERGSKTRIKALLCAYSTMTLPLLSQNEISKLLIPVRKPLYRPSLRSHSSIARMKRTMPLLLAMGFNRLV